MIELTIRKISQLRKLFYSLYYGYKQLIPKRIIINLRSKVARFKKNKYKKIWPIQRIASDRPEWFNGWPNKKRFAFILRHDVESSIGYDNIEKLMRIEENFDFRSVFNLLLRVYPVDEKMLDLIRSRGFEVGIHGVVHDATLYLSKSNFLHHARIINEYIYKYRCSGFASPSSFHNLEWMHHLDIKYDSSTFDTDPIEPQNDAVSTIFPFCVKNDSHEFIEIPYTLPQDFTMFILLKEKSIDIWKRKIDWIAENGGMVFVNVHPDYLRFDNRNRNFLNYPVDYYYQMLEYLKTNYRDQFWHVLPEELARFCMAQQK